MPELPEVEALRLGLVQRIIGSKILNIKVLNEKLISGKGTTRKVSHEKTKEFIENLTGKKIVEIKRRAKNLIFILDSGEIILVHLKMTGQLVFKPSSTSPNLSLQGRGIVQGGHPIEESETTLPHKHTYIIFELNNGTLYYNDVRQFGYVLYFPAPLPTSPLQGEEYLHEHFGNLGVEPFNKKFTLKYFQEKIKDKVTKSKNKKSNPPIKKVLLDQEIVVGCGNIYCDEILWSSGVLPTRGIKSLKESEIKKIYENIKLILDRAINSGGSSVANYLLADGKRGNYADFHNAYKKQGTNCKFKVGNKKCSGIITKKNFAGRGTHFCPIHQK